MKKRAEKKEHKIKFTKKVLCNLMFVIILVGFFLLIDKSKKSDISVITRQEEVKEANSKVKFEKVEEAQENRDVTGVERNDDLDWNLILVNSDNKMPDNYEIDLESIDQYRKFDSRAILYLNRMINDMKKSGINGIWVQSAYRSVGEQEIVYNSKIKSYIKQGISEEEAKLLTEKVINKPGYSEHNLGLAVDFNYVRNSFENTKEFNWLEKNAENYGFILRYPKDKEEITNVEYEPWHWRYVGEDNAKKMNELGICLEEYIEILND